MEIFDSFLINSFDSWVNVEIFRPRGDVLEDFSQSVMRNTSIRTPHSRRSDFADLILNLIKIIEFLMDNFLVIFFVFACKAILKLFKIFLCDNSFS